jgi:hypothetical protein
MEALGMMISAVVSGGLLSSFSVGIVTDISHLLLVNDTFFFCGANPNHLHNLRSLFLCFEVVSSLKTNLAKSELGLVGNIDMSLAWLGFWVVGLHLYP